MVVFRSIGEASRENPSWQERWGDLGHALITCWERGRELAGQDSDIAAAARAGELVPLSWKGGVAKPSKPNQRYGSLYYLATWQGLRGGDLDIDTAKSPELRCSRHGTVIRFTENVALLG